MDSRPNQLLPNVSSSEERAVQKDLEVQQKRIYNKLWNTVERVMGAMRGDLLATLKEVGRSSEEQEKIIECVIALAVHTRSDSIFRRILLEIAAPNGEDPIWAFFDAQHAHITSSMKSTQQAHVAIIEGE